MDVYESIISGLNEAIRYENGNLKAKTSKLSVAPLPDFDGDEIRSIRMSLNMTQVVFASVMGVSEKTIEAWEGGRCKPSGAAVRMLSMLKSDPELPQKYNLLVR